MVFLAPLVLLAAEGGFERKLDAETPTVLRRGFLHAVHDPEFAAGFSAVGAGSIFAPGSPRVGQAVRQQHKGTGHLFSNPALRYRNALAKMAINIVYNGQLFLSGEMMPRSRGGFATAFATAIVIMILWINCADNVPALTPVHERTHVPQETADFDNTEIGDMSPIPALQCALHSARIAAPWGAASSLFPPSVVRGCESR